MPLMELSNALCLLLKRPSQLRTGPQCGPAPGHPLPSLCLVSLILEVTVADFSHTSLETESWLIQQVKITSLKTASLSPPADMPRHQALPGFPRKQSLRQKCMCP